PALPDRRHAARAQPVDPQRGFAVGRSRRCQPVLAEPVSRIRPDRGRRPLHLRPRSEPDPARSAHFQHGGAKLPPVQRHDPAARRHRPDHPRVRHRWQDRPALWRHRQVHAPVPAGSQRFRAAPQRIRRDHRRTQVLLRSRLPPPQPRYRLH
ncbi:hypothetical protein OY671_012301, partial [Metschnikowia pulcherrima]